MNPIPMKPGDAAPTSALRTQVTSETTTDAEKDTSSSLYPEKQETNTELKNAGHVIENEPNILLVDWDSLDSHSNPMNWSSSRKWTIIALVSAITFIASFASTIFAPGVPQILSNFHSDSTELASFVVSVYLIGFCLGPLVLAPLSELYGRLPVIHISNIFFFVTSIACALSINLPMLITFRLLSGIAGCAPVSIGGGMIADIVPDAERGKYIALWSIGPLMGPIIGPVVGGFLVQGIGWRWIFWLLSIISGALTIASGMFLRETYAPTLLRRKTIRMRQATGVNGLKSKYDKGGRPGDHFKMAIIRPTKLLFLSPIVLLLALDVSIIYSYLYLLFTTFTPVFVEHYGFNPGEAGLAFLGLGLGFVIAQIMIGLLLDKYVERKSAEGSMKPEYRLPPLIIGAFIVPFGLVWYGWTTGYRIHRTVPMFGTVFIGAGTLLTFLPIQIYLIDAFTIYAASALATNTVLRSMFGAIIPLAGESLYARLGLGWGNSLLAFIALALSPVPFLLIKYGERIRTSPRYQLSL